MWRPQDLGLFTVDLGSRPPVGLRPSISLHGFEGSTALGAPPVQQAGQVTGLTGSTTPTSQGHALAQDVGQSHHSLTVGLWDALEVPCGTFQSEGPLASGPVPSQSSVQGIPSLPWLQVVVWGCVCQEEGALWGWWGVEMSFDFEHGGVILGVA